jgi:hypothetical protein
MPLIFDAETLGAMQPLVASSIPVSVRIREGGTRPCLSRVVRHAGRSHQRSHGRPLAEVTHD